MAITAKSLADGQLPNGKGTLYTVPGATKTYLVSINLYNSNTTDEVVVLYAKRSGSSSRVIYSATLSAGQGAEVLSGGAKIILSAADLIEGTTTTASKVDYTITGAEEA